MFIKIDWVSPLTRRRYREAEGDLQRPRLGETDERRVADDLYGKRTGAVAPSVRHWLAGGYKRGN